MIRVVSWNVLADAYVKDEYYPHTPPGALDRPTRRNRVVARLAAHAKTDVICLQEVDGALFALAEEKLPGSKGRHFKKRGRGEGCAIFVRDATTLDPEWRELIFSDRSGHVALGVTFAGVTVVTTHLKWEPLGIAPGAHRGRVQLAEVLDAWPSGSRIVCGDFNAEWGSDVLRVAEARGFLDAYATMPDASTCNANEKPRRIDFILHTPDFEATPTALPGLTAGTPLPGEEHPSDHLPIEAALDR